MSRNTNTNPKRSITSLLAYFTTSSTDSRMAQILLLGSTALLVALGVVMVYSASSISLVSEGADPTSEVVKQCGFAAAGVIGLVVAARFATSDLLRSVVGYAAYALLVGLILLTALMGVAALGATRWLVIGPISLQPSEFAKIGFVFITANLIMLHKEGSISFSTLVGSFLVIVGIPILIMFVAQSDLGTTVICAVALFALFYFSDIVDTRILVGVFLVCIVLGVLAIATSEYRMARFTSFLDPWADADDSGYQLIHSYKALGAGGLFGVGLGNSYQKMLYLPEAETDFIFAIIGEELGLVGAIGVIALFLFFLKGGLDAAANSETEYGYLVAGALTVMVVFQALLNISCVVGMAPVTGKPLPFISSGGSSLISSLLVVGVILGVTRSGNRSDDVHRERRGVLHVVSSHDGRGGSGRGGFGGSGRGDFGGGIGGSSRGGFGGSSRGRFGAVAALSRNGIALAGRTDFGTAGRSSRPSSLPWAGAGASSRSSRSSYRPRR